MEIPVVFTPHPQVQNLEFLCILNKEGRSTVLGVTMVFRRCCHCNPAWLSHSAAGLTNAGSCSARSGHSRRWVRCLVHMLQEKLGTSRATSQSSPLIMKQPFVPHWFVLHAITFLFMFTSDWKPAQHFWFLLRKQEVPSLPPVSLLATYNCTFRDSRQSSCNRTSRT